MSWVDVATLGGLAIALWQLVQLGRVTSATHRGMSGVVSRMGNYSVMMLVPQLSSIERDCQRAASDGDSDATLDALRRWHECAASLKGYLPKVEVISEEMLIQITASLGAATRAKSQIVDSTVSPLEATRIVRNKMTRVCQEAAELAAKMQVQVDPPAVPRTLAQSLAAAKSWLRGERSRDV